MYFVFETLNAVVHALIATFCITTFLNNSYINYIKLKIMLRELKPIPKNMTTSLLHWVPINERIILRREP